jgi:excisionase family DNA binding protein
MGDETRLLRVVQLRCGDVSTRAFSLAREMLAEHEGARQPNENRPTQIVDEILHDRADREFHRKVSTRTVRRWIQEGLLVAHRINGLVRISEADFQAFLATHRDR